MQDGTQRLILLREHDRVAIQAMVQQRDLTPRIRERLEMVKAADLGHDLLTIAAWSGRSAGTVRHWLDRFADAGIAGLADAPRAGRPVQADAAYLTALEQAVETSPRNLGLPFDVWTSPRLSAYLDEQTGVAISPGWLRALLARQHFARGRPKHTLDHVQDADEVAACVAELARWGKKVAAQPARYELHHQDETHVETNPYLCRVWHRRGTQPTLPAVGTNRRVTVFGSVEVFGRGRVEVVQARQDSAGFIRYLEVLEARH